MIPTATTADLKALRGDLESGFYALRDLRAFVAIDGSAADAERVPQWLRATLNPVDRRPRHPDYSFADLISLFVVRELLRKGVAAHTIRDAEIWLRRKWKTERPFISGEIQTDGRGIFVDDNLVAGQIESADRHGQQVLRELVRERLTRVHYHEGSAAYWTPVNGVLIDPRVQFGAPVLTGTRLTTGLVSAAARELGRERAAQRFRIAADDVTRAVRFEKRLESVG
jgi:uncharacterized protein (DUF433 family)